MSSAATTGLLQNFIDLTSEDELAIAPQQHLDDSGLPRTIKHVWTSDQRIFLFFARRRHENSWEETAKLFNHAFSVDLHRRGLPDGLLARTIQAQFADGPRYHKEDFRRVLTTPFAQLPNEFRTLERRIAKIAVQQRLKLVPKNHDTWPESYRTPTNHKRKRRESLDTIEPEPLETHLSPSPTFPQSTQPAQVPRDRGQPPQTHIPRTPQRPIQALQLVTPSTTVPSSSSTSTPSSLVGKGFQSSGPGTPRRSSDVLGGLPTHGKITVPL